ncbi:hypothetical protein P691DRAFT_72149 [Macrolepiota fuliginosa MF-IS2]|uniref:Uncharacterized protein n=1 Tax=Macrolepiota fuliginosa MF-IS2 TaxID=1400762 RepID=A0A9P5WYM7_9AGAR|nr:hypothetical protein P691DRAFT_72149 [Macrolepiota fuliginosa MF-IS2]
MIITTSYPTKPHSPSSYSTSVGLLLLGGGVVVMAVAVVAANGVSVAFFGTDKVNAEEADVDA